MIQVDTVTILFQVSTHPDGLESRLARRHGLSTAEASLAASLLAGLSTTEHAIARGVDAAMLQLHQRGLQQKLGCDGPEALAARLAAEVG